MLYSSHIPVISFFHRNGQYLKKMGYKMTVALLINRFNNDHDIKTEAFNVLPIKSLFRFGAWWRMETLAAPEEEVQMLQECLRALDFFIRPILASRPKPDKVFTSSALGLWRISVVFCKHRVFLASPCILFTL